MPAPCRSSATITSNAPARYAGDRPRLSRACTVLQKSGGGVAWAPRPGYLHEAYLRYRFAGQADPWLLLAAFVAFVAVWGLYAAISDAPIAIHQDMSEAYVWGREFQLGYNQHPPFWAWIAGVWFSLMPRTTWSFDLLAVLNAGIGLLGAWWLIGDFTTGARRIAATVLLLLTPVLYVPQPQI